MSRKIGPLRSSTPADLEGRCRACFLPLGACVCARVPRVSTVTEFLILRHIKESWKSSNTARLAALALTRCALKEYGRANEPILPPLDLSGTWLLFPDAAPAVPPGRPCRIVVLDGTWGQARRMAQRLEWLRGLPRLSLAPVGRIDGLRRQREASGMSTLVAIARAIAVLESVEDGRRLEELHADFVARVRALRGGPNPA
jgi:DTW domain-containing protein YfiP